MPPLTGVHPGDAAITPQEVEAGTHKVYRGPSSTGCLLSSHVAEKGDIARSAWYRVPLASRAPAAVAATVPSPAAPPLVVGRIGRQAPVRSRDECRGQDRGRGARSQSSSEPLLSGDNTETSDSEEAVSRHSMSESSDDDVSSGSESEEDTEASFESGSGDTGTGSGPELDSGSGANGDSAPESPPRKKTKRASQA
ncbi:uncharacterized protein LOC114317482 [Camellia sinensis]|uniref:uncharacterized protein LOC114317482 n=1 Tax=Camellia sinensis TaxID=4442 RepID=UPI001035FFA3|nr:uncharacterized protein LOC114317482 [Camellia sinensis]